MKGFLNGTQLRFEHPVKQIPLIFRADQVTDHGNGDYCWTGFSAQGRYPFQNWAAIIADT